MAFPFWTADLSFNVNHIIIIGWLALIFQPFRKISNYFVLAPALVLSAKYALIVYEKFSLIESRISPFELFHLLEWFASCKNLLALIGRTSHFGVIDLWLAQWMVNDFYSNYTFAYSIKMDRNGTYQVKKSFTSGRIIFTLILLLTYVAPPLGFLVYHLAKFIFLYKYKADNPINFQDKDNFVVNSNFTQLQTEALTRRFVRFGDKLPKLLQKIYHFIQGIVGLIVLFTVALPTYILLVIYCRIKYRTPSNLTTTDESLKPNKFIPDYVRNETANIRFELLKTPSAQRKMIWQIKFYLLQFATIIEYGFNSINPIALFTTLDDYFKSIYNGRYFIFGDGIGVSSYNLVKRYLQDIPPHKGPESLGWRVSTSQETFCDFTTIFLSSNLSDMSLGRKIVFNWLHAFPYDLRDKNSEALLYLSRLVPRKIDQQPDADSVYQAVGEVMFFLATGGELRKHERDAFLDCVKNPSIFFPNWFNFLLAGHYLERKNLNSYYTLLQAFSRYADRQALCAAFKAAGTEKSQLEVLKLVAIVFSIAGSAAPAKLAFAVIEKLWSDKNKYVPLFKKNPHNFIKECARLDKVVPMVNILATKEIADEIAEDFGTDTNPITILEDTPIHCSLVNANRDKDIFQNPDEFNPERPELNKMIVWNGVEEDIMNNDRSQRPVRYCPGHDLSLDVIQYVAERFSPVIPEDDDKNECGKIFDIKQDVSLNSSISPSKKHGKQNGFSNGTHHATDGNGVENNFHANDQKFVTDKMGRRFITDEDARKLIFMSSHISRPFEQDRACYDILDNYTKLVMKLMRIAVKQSNSSPARGSDIFQPLSTPVNNLDMIRLEMSKFIPTWDEDDPKGSKLSRTFARWFVNQNIWDFNDCQAEFISLEDAIKWRTTMFADLPLPNVVYNDPTSDETMTQLAFAGCGCQYTHRMGKDWHPGNGIPDEEVLTDAVYVNDMTGLAIFDVRKSFERYGAAAYFDKNYKIIAIYWSHQSRLVRNDGKDPLWNHVKYVWRSTLFAYITINDHLIVTHMIEGNAFVTASRKCLPVNHPLRKLVKPFTYRTVSINYQAAKSLINERGLVHRIWAFDYDSFLKVCDYISMNYKFRLLPDIIPESMTPQANGKTDEEWDKIYPIYHDLNKYWAIVQNYVTEFFRINYHDPTDNDNLPNDVYLKAFIHEICEQLGIPGITSLKHLINVLSQLISAGTGVHEHVGQVSDYMVDPRFIGAKLREGREMQDIQTYTQILVLSVLTGLRMPGLLEDWSHLIDHDEHSKSLQNYKTFKAKLQNLSKEIHHRNQIRNYPFQSFNPKNMECSISV